jgi:predicted nuclease of predicted toxin-antitoxin system
MIRLDVALALRGAGHDVVRVSEVGQSRVDDEQILEKAIAENRILVTLDEHFGEVGSSSAFFLRELSNRILNSLVQINFLEPGMRRSSLVNFIKRS